MANRVLRIRVVSADKDAGKKVKGMIDYRRNVHFPVEIDTYPVSPQSLDLVDHLARFDDQIYILDWKFPSPLPSGKQIAEQLMDKGRNASFIFSYDSKEPPSVDETSRTAKKGGMAFVEYEQGLPIESIKLISAIKENARKPLDVAVVGGGGFSRAYIDWCDKNPASVRQTKVLSRSISSDEDVKKGFSSMYSSRTSLVNSLDDLMDSEVMLLAASNAGYDENNKKFPAVDDPARLGLFKYEIELYNKLWGNLIDRNYKGFVVVATNPNGGIAEIGRRKGFPAERITAPLNIDVKRALDYLEREKEDLRLDLGLSEVYTTSFLEMARTHLIVGPHGMPTVGFPDNFKHGVNESSVENLQTRLRAIVRNSWDEGIIEGRLQRVPSGFPLVKKAAEAAAELLEDMATYKQLRSPAYCLDSRTNVFTGYPTVMTYFPSGAEIYINEGYVKSSLRNGDACIYVDGLTLPQVLQKHRRSLDAELVKHGFPTEVKETRKQANQTSH